MTPSIAAYLRYAFASSRLDATALAGNQAIFARAVAERVGGTVVDGYDLNGRRYFLIAFSNGEQVEIRFKIGGYIDNLSVKKFSADIKVALKGKIHV